MKSISLQIDDGIARISINTPDDKLNKFSAEVMAELGEAVRTVATSSGLQAVVFSSGKPGIFIAGADIRELQAIRDLAEALTKAQAGQRLFQRIAELPVPTIAVIDGACLGGGLEFALACSHRIVTDEDKTNLGLPEVTLGIMPGWGGTQRLPRLIGMQAALDLILTGKTIPARKAVKLGLADVCVARAFLTQEVEAMIARVRGKTPIMLGMPNSSAHHFGFLEGTPLGRIFLFKAAKRSVLAKTRGLMPAPLAALEVLRRTASCALAHGLDIEAKAFAQLAVTPSCKALIDLFFANEAVRKEGALARGTAAPAAPEVRQAAVLGAGVMGGGIAWAMANKGIPVRLKDLSWEAIAKGLHTAQEYNGQLVRIRKLTKGMANLSMHRISGTVDFKGLQPADVVVEAVVEDLTVKRRVLRELEDHIRDDCLVCTNTSSLLVTAIAEGMRHPERVVGMHFFNPVNRMPLVEVVPGATTTPEAVAAVANLVRRLGKTAIVVKDVPGFLVNRILLPYLNEAARCLEDGAAIETVDRTLTSFGMPMGAFALSDEVGLDVGFKVATILATHYGERLAVAETLRLAYQDLHLLGNKGGGGFYVKQSGRSVANPLLVSAQDKARSARATPRALPSPAEILDRCLLIMVNEAARCLEEQVVQKASLLDLAMIMGTGFPPQRGGLIHYANQLGVRAVAARLVELQHSCGARFAPCQLICDLARDDRPFPL